MASFGTLLKDLRIGYGMSLNTAASMLSIPPGVLGKIERGIDPAPSDRKVLFHWANLMGLGGQTLDNFMAAAEASIKAGPAPLPTDADIERAMPALYHRTIPADKAAVMRSAIRESLTPTAHLEAAQATETTG